MEALGSRSIREAPFRIRGERGGDNHLQACSGVLKIKQSSGAMQCNTSAPHWNQLQKQGRIQS
jgi:hypothetical protein